MKKNIILIISCFLLVASIAIFGYLKNENQKLNSEIDDLKGNINKVEEKITEDKEEKENKTSEYEKLQEEVKEKVEELNIWKELEEKLNTALS